MPRIGDFLSVHQSRRHMDAADRMIAQATERLATGSRINRASDDPSGMIIGQSLAVEQRIIEKRIAALERETTRLGAVEGAHSVVADLLIELDSLVVQAANRAGLAEGDLAALQIEADSIIQTIDYLAATAVHNGERILQASAARDLGAWTESIQGEDGEPTLVYHSLASLATGREFNLIDGDLEQAQRASRAAIDATSARRAGVGLRLNAVDSEIELLQTELENVAAARSLIVDADLAKEVAALVRAQILKQAAQFAQQTALGQHAATILGLLG